MATATETIIAVSEVKPEYFPVNKVVRTRGGLYWVAPAGSATRLGPWDNRKEAMREMRKLK